MRNNVEKANKAYIEENKLYNWCEFLKMIALGLVKNLFYTLFIIPLLKASKTLSTMIKFVFDAKGGVIK
ncbi:MAG TPA: hypothetical protein DCO93_03235 [Clostridiales bacterium]|nr:hypothetical protein [Clostridiales bacterium]